MHVAMKAVSAAVLAGLATAPVIAAECRKSGFTNLDAAMYLLSKPQDSVACAMKVADGKIAIEGGVTNPAMGCPDMFSWKLFADAVKAEFWKNWASDDQTWPAHPYALCPPNQKGPHCCDPGTLDNPGYGGLRDPAKYCPYYPGDHQAQPQRANAVRLGQPPSKLHVPNFLPRLLATPRAAPGPGAVDPGRIIRQTMTELTLRNRSMLQFIFSNDLYNNQGLAKVYAANVSNLRTGAPYRRASVPGALAEIDLPVDAVMIKSNWLWANAAQAMNLEEDPEAPHIRMTIRVNVGTDDAPQFEDRVFWLLSFHVSSKDTPNWIWTTFEYVTNPGRCDYTGCNDSYGFDTPDSIAAGQATNYTAPAQQCDNLDAPSWIWQTGGDYAGGKIRSGLSAVFDAMGIGTQPASDGPMPSPGDKGWRGYRLKGSQTNFTDSTGLPTHLANSVTEGGFVSTSSCITCHARAALSAPSGGFPALSVFVNQPDVTGYLQSANGAPDPTWFLSSRTPPTVVGLQTDFIWGFFNSNDLATPPAAGVLLAPGPDQDRVLTVRRRTQENR